MATSSGEVVAPTLEACERAVDSEAAAPHTVPPNCRCVLHQSTRFQLKLLLWLNAAAFFVVLHPTVLRNTELFSHIRFADLLEIVSPLILLPPYFAVVKGTAPILGDWKGSSGDIVFMMCAGGMFAQQQGSHYTANLIKRPMKDQDDLSEACTDAYWLSNLYDDYISHYLGAAALVCMFLHVMVTYVMRDDHGFIAAADTDKLLPSSDASASARALPAYPKRDACLIFVNLTLAFLALLAGAVAIPWAVPFIYLYSAAFPLVVCLLLRRKHGGTLAQAARRLAHKPVLLILSAANILTWLVVAVWWPAVGFVRNYKELVSGVLPTTQDGHNSAAGAGASTPLPRAEELVFQSLLVLGFDPVAAEEKFGVQFGPESVGRGNTKEMDVILHFLLSQLDPEWSARECRHVWPPLDKSQARQFRSLVASKLAELEKSGDWPAGTFRKSLLDSTGGERLVLLLWWLSSHTLESVLRGRFARFPAPQLPPAFDRTGKPRGDRITLQLLSRSAKAHLIHQQRALLEHMAAAHAAHQHWSSYAQTLTDRYRAVVRDLYELKLDDESLAQARALHRGIADLVRESDGARSMFATGVLGTQRLDGHKLASLAGTGGNALDLAELLAKWDSALRELAQQARGLGAKGSVLSAGVQRALPALDAAVEEHAESLEAARELQERTEALIASLRESCSSLAVQAQSTLPSAALNGSVPLADTSFHLVPPTPVLRRNLTVAAALTPQSVARRPLPPSSAARAQVAASVRRRVNASSGRADLASVREEHSPAPLVGKRIAFSAAESPALDSWTAQREHGAGLALSPTMLHSPDAAQGEGEEDARDALDALVELHDAENQRWNARRRAGAR